MPHRKIEIDNKESLLTATTEFVQNCHAGLLSPIIHIEAHGCNQGVALPDKSIVSWQELEAFVAPINGACNFNLIIVMSTCCGSKLSETLRPNKPAPFAILVAPKGEIATREIELPSQNFYLDLIRSLNITGSAAEKLGSHEYTSALEFFFREIGKVICRVNQRNNRQLIIERALTKCHAAPQRKKHLCGKKGNQASTTI